MNNYTVYIYTLLFHNLSHHSWLLALLSQAYHKVCNSDKRHHFDLWLSIYHLVGDQWKNTAPKGFSAVVHVCCSQGLIIVCICSCWGLVLDII
jgi:hypothetical protein